MGVGSVAKPAIRGAHDTKLTGAREPFFGYLRPYLCALRPVNSHWIRSLSPGGRFQRNLKVGRTLC